MEDGPGPLTAPISKEGNSIIRTTSELDRTTTKLQDYRNKFVNLLSEHSKLSKYDIKGNSMQHYDMIHCQLINPLNSIRSPQAMRQCQMTTPPSNDESFLRYLS